jgi:hypothetical protein
MSVFSLRSVAPLLLAAFVLVPIFARASTVPVPPTCAPDCVPAITAAIAACGSQPPPCTVALSAGTYPLQHAPFATAFNLNSPTSLSIMGAGDATLLQPADIGNLFSVSGGSDVAFQSFSVDLLRVPYTYGLVIENTPQGALLQFDATGLYSINLTRWPWLGRAQSALGYDPEKGRPSAPPNVTDIYALDNPISLVYLSTTGASAVVRVEGTQLPVGRWQILRHQVYAYNAFNLYGTKGVRVQNVSLLSLGGMGVYADGVSGGITIDGLSIRKLPGRPLSICADGVHLSNTRGGRVRITNSVFEGQGDDGINVPTIFQQVGWLRGDGLAFQVQARNQPVPAPPLFAAGAAVNFFNVSSIAPLGQGQVASIGANNTVFLAAPAPAGVGLFSLVNNAGMYADEVEVTHSLFRNNRARGALLKSSNVYAAYNTFDGCSIAAAKTEVDACYWYEGHPVTNWSFIGNIVREVNYWSPDQGDVRIDNAVPTMVNGKPDPNRCIAWTSTESFVQHGVNISGNTFVSPWGAPIAVVQSTDGVVIAGNTVQRGGAQPLSFDFLGQGTARADVTGNTCGSGQCTQSGFNP